MSKKRINSQVSKQQQLISFKRKLRNYYMRTIQILILGIIIASIAFLKASYFAEARAEIINNMQEVRAELLPWQLEHIQIVGNNHLSNHQIIELLKADIGTPIFDIDISASLKRLNQNGWVEAAIIKRQLPNTIYIEIIERTPIAIWQYNHELKLIDTNGYIITDQDLTQYAELLHVVGEDARVHARALLSYLEQSPEIQSELLSAIRYGSRRWNLAFQEGFIVKMPEDADFEKAWKYLLKLQTQNKLFNELYKSIDLRNSEKYFIEYKQ